MGILDRMLLAVYALATAAIAVGAMVLFTQVVPTDWTWNNFMYLYGRWEMALGGFIFLAASLRLLKVSLSSSATPRRMKEAVIVHGQMGDVRVTIDAVRNLVDRIARGVHGVRDVKIDITVETAKQSPESDPAVRVLLRLVTGQDTGLVGIADEVREAVRQSLTHVVGLETAVIEIQVDDMSNAAVNKQRVV